MTNSRAEAAYHRAVAAFKNPTLDLLHGRHAPFVVAALSIVFVKDRPVVPIPDAHAEVADILDQLRAAGYDQAEHRMPVGSAREVCSSWVRLGWLVRQLDGDVEVYRLSAHAVGALEIAGRTSGGGSRVSRSRMRTLLEAVEELSHRAETDPAVNLAALRARRDALDEEIARLEAGGPPEAVDEVELLEEAENVLHLARELPADFTRVAESIKAMQRDVVSDLRQDVRPTGEVLREYLQRGQHVMESTPEGRAFAGALRLIGDPGHIDQLATHLSSLLGKPFAQSLTAEQREELRAIGRRVEHGVQEVLTAQRRASQVITAQVRAHDPVRDRQVDDLLRDVMSGLQGWMQHGGRAEVPVEPLRSFPVADIEQLRQTVSDLRPTGGPSPLQHADDVEFVDSDTRSWGGPRYPQLEEYVRSLGDSFDLAEAFEGAGDDTRRPVDLLGLLEIAHRNGMVEGDSVSFALARRPDGTTRRFAFSSVTASTTKEDNA